MNLLDILAHDPYLHNLFIFAVPLQMQTTLLDHDLVLNRHLRHPGRHICLGSNIAYLT